MCARRLAVAVSVLALGLAGGAGARPKTDVLTLRNGDRITCEIQQLTRGKLTAKTDDAGTLEIEWDAIVGLRSTYYFRIEDRFGRRWFGALSMDDGGPLRIGAEAGLESIAPFDVVEIHEIERSFWSQLDGSLSVGASFTKASNVGQFSFDWSNSWRTERNLVDFKASSIVTDDRDNDDRTLREDLSLAYTRLLRRKWTGTVGAGFQKNDELALDHRFLLGAASGATPLKSNLNVLLVEAGLVLNSEQATGSDVLTESMEGVLSASYSLFKYDTPKSNLDTTLDYYPSVTEPGRHRIDFNVKLRHEMIPDLFIDLSYYTNFDSDAPGDEREKTDYGIVTSLGWTY
jgi:hypothetical protein